MQVTIGELKKQVEDGIALMDSLLEKQLPGGLADAVNQKFVSTVGATEDWLAAIPEQVRHEWSKRIMSVNAANQILRAFESAMVQAYVLDENALALKLAHSLVARAEWILGHLGEVTALMFGAGSMVAEKTRGFWEATLEFAQSSFIAPSKYDKAAQNRMDAAHDAYNEAKEKLALADVAFDLGDYFVSQVVVLLVYESVLALSGAAAFTKGIAVVHTRKKAASTLAGKKAFPQIQKGRFRRRKVSRK